MRAKEAVDNERKVQSRNLEKQGKAIERLVDSERNLMAQVVRIILCCVRLPRLILFARAIWKRKSSSGRRERNWAKPERRNSMVKTLQ